MTTTANLEVEKIEQSQSQKEVTANEAFDVFDAALSEIVITLSGSPTITTYTLSESTTPQEWQYGILRFTGAIANNVTVVAPTNAKHYVLVNATTGGFGINFTVSGSPASTVQIASGSSAFVRVTSAGAALIASSDAIATFSSQSANTVLAGPSSGGAATPAFRALVEADLTAPAILAYDVGGFYPGVPTSSALLLRHDFTRAATFASEFSGSKGSASVAATGSTTFTIAKNGVTIGTFVFGAGGTTASFFTAASPTTSVSFAAGDVLTVTAPGSADATLANVSFTLKGTRT